MQIPLSTYRLQFNSSFTFQQARELVPYLAALGISHIYAAPIFRARRASTHGYDIVDPNQLNPECGDPAGFQDLQAAVREHGMCWLQDIVPNHMAFDSENALLMDVLEQGEHSPYFNFFDIDWNHTYEGLRGRVLAPFLGKFYAETLQDGELQLQYAEGDLSILYYQHRFPLRIESYARIFEHSSSLLEEQLAGAQSEFIQFLGGLQLLKSLSCEEPEAYIRQLRHAKRMIGKLYQENAVIKHCIDETIALYNGEAGNPESFGDLDSLIAEQLFRLSFWKVAAEEINYRRFFTVNDLISVRVEDERVMDHTHRLILRLTGEEVFSGLRVDHIDGLLDPLTYLERLRTEAGDRYIVVEKILDAGEQLPLSWPVQGTTGYDFLNWVNGLFCRQDNRSAMSALYQRFTGQDAPYEDLICDKKRLIIGKHMAGNIDNLAQFLKNISSRDRYGRDITLYGLRRALVEVMAHFPVYRTYINHTVQSEADQAYIKDAIQKAQAKTPGLVYELAFIEKFLLLQYEPALPEEDRRQWVQFAMNFQQYTGPLMAKGFEDTVLYIYNRLISLNEVGSSPHLFGCSLEEFHTFNEQKLQTFPLSMNATSTHDTKRGEDVRTRITVLSELPKEWEAQVKAWSKLNRPQRKGPGGRVIPDANDEYFLYQTLIGAFPSGGIGNDFIERIKQYIIKAVREAKVHTAWIKPDTEYEAGCAAFVEHLLRPAEDNQFLREFVPFQKKIACYGMLNSLSQTLLKITCPGSPDFYQGTELWELSLVDPDNRVPVDFKRRQAVLDDLLDRAQTNLPELLGELLAAKEDGRIKLFLICRALRARREAREVFDTGAYIPLVAEGEHKQCVVAFARTCAGRWALTVAPRFFTALAAPGVDPLGEQVWGDTRIMLPQHAPQLWRDAITGQELLSEQGLCLGRVLNRFPAALLMHDPQP